MCSVLLSMLGGFEMGDNINIMDAVNLINNDVSDGEQCSDMNTTQVEKRGEVQIQSGPVLWAELIHSRKYPHRFKFSS